MDIIPDWLIAASPSVALAVAACIALALWMRRRRPAQPRRVDNEALRQQINYVTGSGAPPGGESDAPFSTMPEALITEWKPSRAFGRAGSAQDATASMARGDASRSPAEADAPQQAVRFILVEPTRAARPETQGA